MLIDRKQTGWAVGAAIVGAGAVALYMWDAPRHINGPSGSTPLGLTFGIVALALMLFCTALSLKRRAPHWRIGRAQSWLRAHVWLGLLTVLLVGLHGAFRAGGPLTTWLWVLLGVVACSGAFGVMLQQFMPRLLLHGVPGETLAQQIDKQLANIRTLAEQIVIECAGTLTPPKTASIYYDVNEVRPGENPWPTPEPGEPVCRFHRDYLEGFLAGDPRSQLLLRNRSRSLFAALLTMTPPSLHPAIDELEQLCERRRDIVRQRRMMRILHCWLLVHVPATWALIVLTLAHAAVALRWKGF